MDRQKAPSVPQPSVQDTWLLRGSAGNVWEGGRVQMQTGNMPVCDPHATGGGTSSSSLGTLFLAWVQGAGCSPGGSQTMHHELYASIVSRGSKFSPAFFSRVNRMEFSICVTVFFIVLVISYPMQLPRKGSVYIVIPY